MVGNPFHKVHAGERLSGFPARLYNSLIDMVQWWERERRTSGLGQVQHYSQDQTRIRVRNDSADDRDQFDVLALNGSLWDPTDGASFSPNKVVPYQQTPLCKGKEPYVTADDGTSMYSRFVVCAEAIPQGKIGWGIIKGITACRVVINGPKNTHADLDIDGGSCVALKGQYDGCARILDWKVNVDPPAMAWALVDLNPGNAGIIDGELSADLALGGSSSARFTYECQLPDGTWESQSDGDTAWSGPCVTGALPDGTHFMARRCLTSGKLTIIQADRCA